MHRTRWSIFFLAVVFCGIVAGTAPCRAGLLPAAVDSECCEESMELDLCGDTCAACSEQALVSSSETSGQASATDQDQTPAIVLLHARPAPDRSPAGLARAGATPNSPPLLPAHLSSTVLLR